MSVLLCIFQSFYREHYSFFPIFILFKYIVGNNVSSKKREKRKRRKRKVRIFIIKLILFLLQLPKRTPTFTKVIPVFLRCFLPQCWYFSCYWQSHFLLLLSVSIQLNLLGMCALCEEMTSIRNWHLAMGLFRNLEKSSLGGDTVSGNPLGILFIEFSYFSIKIMEYTL